MINTLSILTGNILAIIIVITLMLNLPYGFTNGNVQARVFTWFSIPIILGAIFGVGYAFFDGAPGEFARLMSIICGSVDIITPILMSVVFWFYVESTGKESFSAMKLYIVAALIPMVIITLMVIINLFVPIVFSISPENVYQRGPLGLIGYVVGPTILLYSIIRISYLKIKRRGFLFSSIIGVVIPIAVVGYIQVRHYGIIQSWIGFAIGTLTLYVGMQKDFLYMDSMTKVFNRMYLDYIVNEAKANSTPLGGVMLDIDHFKSINDQLGHHTGDLAIRKAAYILQKSAGNNSNVIRVGGDEFMVVMRTDNEEELSVLMEKIRLNAMAESLKSDLPVKVEFSMGSAIFHPDRENDVEWRARMDAKMYEEKASHRIERRGRRASDDSSL